MPISPTVRKVLNALTAIGLAVGIALSYWEPQWPLLGYWLLFSVSLGVAFAFASSDEGFGPRVRRVITANAIVVAVALATTQLAARRAISATHLQYRGVHVVGVDSFTVGAGGTKTDIRLQNSGSAAPWSIRVSKQSTGWRVEPIAGVEQLRIGTTSGFSKGFSVAQSVVLSPDDWVAISEPSGRAVDTLRLRSTSLHSSSADFLFHPVNSAIDARYRRQLRAGASLAALDGERRATAAYERFVRVQELSTNDVVNGSTAPLITRALGLLSFVDERLAGDRRFLVSASAPFTLSSATAAERLDFADSALVEVRNGNMSWRFQLVPWRRDPTAAVGLALLFVRGPRPLDTPLPTGVTCRDGVACGAISLRRLPPPIAQVALDFAGFDPNKFGMLGRLTQDASGYSVVLPRHIYHVERGAKRPVAIPVETLPNVASSKPNAFWVLVSASGNFGDDTIAIVLIGLGLALLLFAAYEGIASSASGTPGIDRFDERWLTLGVVAILAMLLTRVVVGARVAFFAPFLERSIQTAVGLWVATGIVAVGLLSWSAWVPPLLAGASQTLAGKTSLANLARGVGRLPGKLIAAIRSPRAIRCAVLTFAALLCLGIATPSAVIYGIAVGGVILLAWICLACIVAFTGPYFETFEHGPWSVLEQLTPAHRLGAPKDPTKKRWLTAQLEKTPELAIMLASLCLELSLVDRLSVVMAIASLAIVVAAPVIAYRRRKQGGTHASPDYWSAAVGVSAFLLAVNAFRMRSENGSMAAFVLVVFVALASVRIGRSVGSRIENAVRRKEADATSWREMLLSSALLVSPLVLLAPLMIIDMGLFLVVVIPVGFATLLAAGRRVAGWRLLVPGLAFTLLFVVLVPRVLVPSARAIQDADSHAAKATAFENMGRVFGVRLPLVGTSLDRVAARSVATANRSVAEDLLLSAKPGAARDLLIPSIEQIWGGATYASAGFWGGGLGQAVVGGRGVAESVSYAENTFSVFILAEHGAFGGLLVLTVYMLLTLAVGFTAMTGNSESTASYRASRALLLVAMLLIAIPAVYVSLSNLGVVPITGQNMPFLGLNAWSDVALCAGIVGMLITGTIRRTQEVAV